MLEQQFTSLNVDSIRKQMMVFVVMQVVGQACIIIHNEFDNIQDVPFNSTLQCKEHWSVLDWLKFHPKFSGSKRLTVMHA